MNKKQTIPVKVGNIIIGGGHPVSVQTMWKFPLRKVDQVLVDKVNALFEAGCQLLRFAVPDGDTAEQLGQLSQSVPHPLVADIHFDYKLALKCLDFPIAKIRINPGNIGAPWKVTEVVKKAADKAVPLRVGVNSGSLPGNLRSETDVAAAMVRAAEKELEILEKLDFRRVIVSLKSSDIRTTLAANRSFAARYSWPLHLGITEAGPLIPGIVKSSIAFHRLLEEGIGDTIRVSLSDSSLNEIITARQILGQVAGNQGGVNIISCPTCGRTSFDVQAFLKKTQFVLNKLQKKITIAVMGCPVNGPGEAREADLGITGSGRQIILFKKGEIIAKIKEEDEALHRFLEELDKL